MKYTTTQVEEFLEKKLKDFTDNMKWNWRKEISGNLTHHYGRLRSTIYFGTVEEIHYCTENGVVLDAGIGDKYYIYYSDDNKEDEYFPNLEEAEKKIVGMQLDKIKAGIHNQFLETLDIYLYCNVCGEKAHTKDIGIVYGSHTCVSCADNMGEKCQELGLQHI
jgi:hypothetical protein